MLMQNNSALVLRQKKQHYFACPFSSNRPLKFFLSLCSDVVTGIKWHLLNEQKNWHLSFVCASGISKGPNCFQPKMKLIQRPNISFRVELNLDSSVLFLSRLKLFKLRLVMIKLKKINKVIVDPKTAKSQLNWLF